MPSVVIQDFMATTRVCVRRDKSILREAAEQAVKEGNLSRVAKEYNIPRTTLVSYMRRTGLSRYKASCDTQEQD